MKIDLEQIRNLLSVVSQTDITELTIESGDEKITVKKQQAAATAGAPAQLELTTTPMQQQASRPAAAVQEPPAKTETSSNYNNSDKNESDGYVSITSPMVGTFYRAPSPGAPPFVEVGDYVSVGQTVCIIEAMKLMNDLPAEISGRIVKVLVDNGMTVEFGQPLFLVDPKG